MKKLQISTLAFALMGVATGSAMAQSSKTNAWEGAYGQVSVGYGMFNPTLSNGTVKYPPPLSAVPATMSTSNVNNISTGTANIAVGYNFGINSDYVLGVGATYYPSSSSSATGVLTTSLPSPYSVYGASTTATYNVKNLYNIYLSPGYVIDKDRMAYLKVGYTGVTVGLSSPIIPYNTVNLTGYTLGLGYKQMVTSSIYILGEVNYASYGNKTTSVTSTNGVAISDVGIKGTGTDFLVGVGYRF